MQVVVPADLNSAPLRILAGEPHDDAFFQTLCAANPDMRLERTARGEILIMAPTGSETGFRNSEISAQLRNWAQRDGRGRAFDSNAGYTLSNGAIRSPDASWVLKSRLAALTPKQKRGFAPLCPDFVIELLSPGDSQTELEAKMEEWIAQGARLGWLIDPETRHVRVYRPGQAPENLLEPLRVEGENPVAGFTLELADIWAGL